MNQVLSTFGASPELLLLEQKKKPLILGRITEHHKDRYHIITEKGLGEGRVSGSWMIQSLDPKDYPTVGDYVFCDTKEDIWIIHELLPRKSMIERKVAGNRADTQLIAANVDMIFICQSMNENFNPRRLERYLSMAWSSGATPIILLTKKDLTDHPNKYLYQASMAAIGVDILSVSDLLDHGYDDLDCMIKSGLTYVFLGSSGVGKSTIINHLLGHEVMETNAIGYLDRGRHTTTYRSLFLTENKAIVIDTPGMREIQLDSADFDHSFSEITELAKSCKFSDCTHTREPGCAVKASIEDGSLDPSRLMNYQKMKKELHHIEERQKYLERQREKKMRSFSSK